MFLMDSFSYIFSFSLLNILANQTLNTRICISFWHECHWVLASRLFTWLMQSYYPSENKTQVVMDLFNNCHKVLESQCKFSDIDTYVEKQKENDMSAVISDCPAQTDGRSGS